MFTLEELQDIMIEYGIVLRAIPKKTRHVYDPQHKDDFPYGRLEYFKPLDREMWIVENVPEHAGKIMVEQVRSETATVIFPKKGRRYFDTIEDAVNAVADGKVDEIIYRERKGTGPCGIQ